MWISKLEWHRRSLHFPGWFNASPGKILTPSHAQWELQIPSIQPSALVLRMIGWEYPKHNVTKKKKNAKKRVCFMISIWFWLSTRFLKEHWGEFSAKRLINSDENKLREARMRTWSSNCLVYLLKQWDNRADK